MSDDSMERTAPAAHRIQLRTGLRPGDVDAIIRFHGEAYGREFGFDASFETHVAVPLREFARSTDARQQTWIAERDGEMVGCVAVVRAEPHVAQLRWFLVAHEARGTGLGRTLLDHAIRFAEDAGDERMILWTVSVLTTAARLYRSFGFVLVQSSPARLWGLDLMEEKYELSLPRSLPNRRAGE